MKDEKKEYLKVLPDDTEKRKKLKKKSKILNVIGWIISIVAVVFVFILWNLNQIWTIFFFFCTFVTGQGVRMYGNTIKERANSALTLYSKKQLKKYVEEQDQVVKAYFNKNEEIAQKFVKMNTLAKKGKFKDAYNIAKSLSKTKPSPPKRVMLFLEKKMKNYSSHFQK